MVVLAKALSGGLVPVAAVMMRDDVYESVYGSLKRSIIHTSTCSENGLAMCAGLATLDVLEEERLSARAEQLGRELRATLQDRLSRFEMVSEVRGQGLLNGIVMRDPLRCDCVFLSSPFARFMQACLGRCW